MARGEGGTLGKIQIGNMAHPTNVPNGYLTRCIVEKIDGRLGHNFLGAVHGWNDSEKVVACERVDMLRVACIYVVKPTHRSGFVDLWESRTFFHPPHHLFLLFLRPVGSRFAHVQCYILTNNTMIQISTNIVPEVLMIASYEMFFPLGFFAQKSSKTIHSRPDELQ